MSFQVQGQGVARGRGRYLEGNSKFTLEILACREVKSGLKPPMFVVEFSVVASTVGTGASGTPVQPYRPGELVSWVSSVPPFPGGEVTQAKEINAFLLAAVGCTLAEFEDQAQALVDAATGVDNVLEGRVVECATVEAPKKTKPGEFFTYRNFSAHEYPAGEAPAPLAALLTRKGARAPQRPQAPAFPTPSTGTKVPPPPPDAPAEPWAELPTKYHRPPSAHAPKGEWWNGTAWQAK